MRNILRSREFWIVFLLTLASIGIRFWRLGEPGSIVFDETYYAKWAQDYLEGRDFFDVHPPLGKLLIAVGVWLFESLPKDEVGAFGWRFMVALFGVPIVPLTYYVAKKIFGQGTGSRVQGTEENAAVDQTLSPKPYPLNPHAVRIATLAALFVLIDGLVLVQTRTALLDSFLVTFVLGAYASFLSYRDAKTARAAYTWFFLTGIFLGLAMATKWTGMAPVGVLVAWWLALRSRLPKISWPFAIVSFVIAPLALYATSFIFNERTTDFLSYLKDWHLKTWEFHTGLRDPHTYQSRWWSWLYLARPVWYFYKEQDGIVRGIIALGNPILWWASIPALLASLWLLFRHRYIQLLLPLLGFFAAYAPWWIIGRTQFQYYIVGGVPFMFMLLAFWLDRLLASDMISKKALAALVIVLGIASFIFFYPLLTAYPISSAYYGLHVWFKSWI